MKYVVFAALLTLAPAGALAQTQTLESTCYLGVLLDDVALNGVAATRTFTVTSPSTTPAPGYCDPRKYSALVLTLAFTHANNGTLTTTCTVSSSGQKTAADIAYEPTTCTDAAGTCNLNFGGVFVTPSLSASRKYGLRFGHKGYANIKCVTAHGGTPNGSDKLTVYGELVSE